MSYAGAPYPSSNSPIQHDFHREVIEVSEDSEDAKKWPRLDSESSLDGSKGIGNTATPVASSLVATAVPVSEIISRLPSPASSSERAEASTVSSKPPPAKRPGPRKPKTQLIPTQKAKKLTTLDKSAMDWRAHVSSQQGSGVKDELDANRRGGGYLEKVEFLQRVEQRREEVLESSKPSKRRRG